MQTELRKLPAVDRLLQEEALQGLIREHGRELVVKVVRASLDDVRERILAGESCPPLQDLIAEVDKRLAVTVRLTLQPVINATGVVIHTNLGRAPLSTATIAAMHRAAAGYTNLEFDLERGRRGSRYDHAEELLCRLTGAEASLLVNNNAGAVLLILMALARDREVVISRGQLVEIGGGFRIPDVMAQSGARLVEVGTTNRTYLSDYDRAISEATAFLMRVHSSNFRVSGFVHQVALGDLVELARGHGIQVVDDLGSGTLLDTAAFGLAHEPMVQESIAAGASLVSFSGDKLLGGPQAGIIVGKRSLVEQLKRHPLARALRVDKIAIAGIQANLLHYLKGEALDKVPVWRMITMTAGEIETRAEALAAQLAHFGIATEVIEGRSTVGGGSLPGETLPTRLVTLRADSVDALARALRLGAPGVVGRIEDDRLLLDPRTILPDQEGVLCRCVQSAWASLP